jgi:hypothetical protein
MFEAGTQLRADPADTLDQLKALGVDTVKVFVPWNEVAPSPTSRTMPTGFDPANPASYPRAGWAPFDAVARDAAARRIKLDFELGAPAPLWATARGAKPRVNPAVWKPSATQFGLFVRAAGTRYNGDYTPSGTSSPLPRVSSWSIWNEPNYIVQLAPQAEQHFQLETSPALYRGLLDAAWSALSATGHGGDTILIGELAPRGNPSAGGMVPLRFLRALYCVDSSFAKLSGSAARSRDCPADSAASNRFAAEHPALFKASGFALHPYAQGAEPPTFVTPNEPDYADFASRGKVESTLDRLQAVYGSAHRFAIYSTEFGYKTDPPYPGGASYDTASAYLNWTEYLSWRDPRIRSFDQFQLTDPPADSGSAFDTGLETYDNPPKEKPTYAAFRMPIWLPHRTFSSGHAIEVWGCVRPQRFVQRPAPVEIQFRGSAQGNFVTVARIHPRDRDGYFDVARRFPGSGTIRLRWVYPDGTEIFSRAVGITGQ